MEVFQYKVLYYLKLKFCILAQINKYDGFRLQYKRRS
jgi:hypothetical protein